MISIGALPLTRYWDQKVTNRELRPFDPGIMAKEASPGS